MSTILIINGKLINEGISEEQDIFIRDGRIEQIGKNLNSKNAARIIDAAGLIIIPGMIDDQVHFREPGFEHKGEIRTESAAAVAGGVTSYMEMPNTKITTTTKDTLADKKKRASEKSLANYSFYFGATNTNLDAIKQLDSEEACGIKIFMGASTGDMLVDDPKILEGIFANAPMILATHCEDTPSIKKKEDEYKKKYGDSATAKIHPLVRDGDSCYLSSSLAISLAKKHGTNLHILHLTTAKEMDLFVSGQINDKKITAEICVHHLLFDERDYAKHGNFIKCNPSIKSALDRQALLLGLKNDLLDIIATDHAPHTLEEKQQPYWQAPSGLPLVQHAVNAALELYFDGVISLAKVVEKTSHNVAKRFQIVDRGFLREGYWADLALIDLNNKTIVESQHLYSKCGWSPFKDKVFRSRIEGTIVSGYLAWYQGKLYTEVKGKPLEFKRK
mgnify:CR=1 FL=1